MGRARGEVGQRNTFDDVGWVRIIPVGSCGDEEWGGDNNICDVLGTVRRRHSLTSRTHGNGRFSE
jgi:hypothetical protein